MPVDGRDPLGDFTSFFAEEERRAKEALRVYRPAKQLAFHYSAARELILRGGKRSGKTVGVVAEFASRVLGVPITLASGKTIPLKYPVSTPQDGRLYWVIGWDIDHIGQTIHRFLFEPGLFRVIRDKMLGTWRVWNPADSFDKAREEESVPSEPMIPERYIDPNSWNWENKSARNFSSVRLKNGAVICAYPSSSKHAKMGDAVSGIWIDEDIQSPGHLKEWQDRLTDKDGWLMWSVWPHSKNYALCDLLDRADEQADDPAPDIASFQLIMSENPYVPEANKRRALARMGSEEEIARRDRGDLLLDTLNMYDFLPGLHTLEPLALEELSQSPHSLRQFIRKVYTEQGGFPREWTRYWAIDPSHTRTAALCGVIPPPELGEFKVGNLVLIEQEVVLTKCSATALADALLKAMQGFNQEAFIMDQQIGRQTRVGEDKTVFEAYAAAFAKAGLRARMNPHGFIPGSNQPSARYRAVRNMLAINASGLPTLLFIANKTWQTLQEFKTYRKKQIFVGGEDVIMDDPANPRKHDCMAALEYLCAFLESLFISGTAYVAPEAYQAKGSPAYQRAMQIIRKHHEKKGEYVHLGPGAAA